MAACDVAMNHPPCLILIVQFRTEIRPVIEVYEFPAGTTQAAKIFEWPGDRKDVQVTLAHYFYAGQATALQRCHACKRLTVTKLVSPPLASDGVFASRRSCDDTHGFYDQSR